MRILSIAFFALFLLGISSCEESSTNTERTSGDDNIQIIIGGGTIVIDDGSGNVIDTGIDDYTFEDGSTITDKIQDCFLENSKNHGQYVRCVAHLTNQLVRDGIITGEEKGVIMSIAAQTDIGKKK